MRSHGTHLFAIPRAVSMIALTLLASAGALRAQPCLGLSAGERHLFVSAEGGTGEYGTVVGFRGAYDFPGPVSIGGFYRGHGGEPDTGAEIAAEVVRSPVSTCVSLLAARQRIAAGLYVGHAFGIGRERRLDVYLQPRGIRYARQQSTHAGLGVTGGIGVSEDPSFFGVRGTVSDFVSYWVVYAGFTVP